jgi:hypothetical protein
MTAQHAGLVRLQEDLLLLLLQAVCVPESQQRPGAAGKPHRLPAGETAAVAAAAAAAAAAHLRRSSRNGTSPCRSSEKSPITNCSGFQLRLPSGCVRFAVLPFTRAAHPGPCRAASSAADS